jgi:hypothetical protein
LRTVSPNEFYVGQGDTESLQANLLDGLAGVDIAGSSITFVMKNDLGTVRHAVECNGGTAGGAFSIPLTSVETSIPGLFLWQVVVDFPSAGSDNFFGSGYFSDNYLGSFFGVSASAGSTGQQTFPNFGYGIMKIEKAL